MCHGQGMFFSIKDSQSYPIAHLHLLYSLHISSYNQLCCSQAQKLCVGDSTRNLSTEILWVTYLIVDE